MSRLEKLQEFLKESPSDPFLKYAIATEILKLGNEKEAAEHFYKLVESDPDYVGTYYHLGKLLEKLDDEKEALRIYEQGIQVATKMRDSNALRELRQAHQELVDELEY